MTALEAVIADAKAQESSEYWLMGDIFSLVQVQMTQLTIEELLSQQVFEAMGMIVSLRL